MGASILNRFVRKYDGSLRHSPNSSCEFEFFQILAPVIEQPARERVLVMFVFGKLNVDENPITANALGIQSIPTITIFKNGELDGRIGPASNSQIQTKLLVEIQSRTDTNGPYSQNISQDSRNLSVSGDRWAQSSLNDVVIFVSCETLDLTSAVCSICVPDSLD
jgi:hypothetical protein